MAIDVYADYDGHQNQLKNWAADNLAVAPTTPVIGQFYFDTVLNILRTWNGTSWVNGAVSKFATTIGDGILLSYTITHNLGTRDVNVNLFQANSPYGEVVAVIQRTTLNTITVVFSILPPLLNSVRVVVTA